MGSLKSPPKLAKTESPEDFDEYKTCKATYDSIRRTVAKRKPPMASATEAEEMQRMLSRCSEIYLQTWGAVYDELKANKETIDARYDAIIDLAKNGKAANGRQYEIAASLVPKRARRAPRLIL